jgi:hypothetical protein
MNANRWLAALAAVALALLLGAAPAMAQNQDDQGQNNNNQGQNNNSQGSTRSAPEFDPAVAGVIGAIVAGGGLMLARRRRG